MNRWIVGLVLCGAGMGGLPGLVAAQQFAAESAREKDIQSRNTVMGRLVTVNIHEQPLEYVLQAITAGAKVPLQYRGRVFDRYKRPITLRLVKIPLMVALQQALIGTSLQVVPDGPERLVVVEMSDSPSVSTGTVVVVVKSRQDGSPVNGADLTIVHSDQQAHEIRVQDGHQGAYRIELPAGNHTLNVRALGFTRLSQPVTVRAGVTTTVEIQLERTTSVLNEVIVTGTIVATERRVIPTPITVITAQDIEQRGITRVEQLFRGEVPGVLAMEQGSAVYGSNLPESAQGITSLYDQMGGMVTSKLFSRGSSMLGGFAGSLKTYIDGVELLDGSYLGTIDPQSIERIEIVAGPQAATIYGSGAMGGVMQIFTKKGTGYDRPNIALSLKYGAIESNMSSSLTPRHNHSLNVAGGEGAAFTYSANVSYQYSGAWRPMLFARSSGGQIGAMYHRGPVTVNGSASGTMSANGTFSGDAGPYQMERRVNGDWIQNTSHGIWQQQIVSKSISQTLSLSVDYTITPSWHHHLTLGANQATFRLEPQAPRYAAVSDTLFKYRSTDGTRSSGSYNTTLASPQWEGISSTLTVGMTGSWGNNMKYTWEAKDRSNPYYANTSIQKLLDSKSYGGFGSWRIGFADRVFATLGIRGEKSPAYGNSHKIDWTTTNGITYTLDVGDLTLKMLASYGTATRAPTPSAREGSRCTLTGFVESDYQCWVPNPHLTPEYERGPQGGIEAYYGNVGSFTLNRYRQRVTDLITTIQRVDTIWLTRLTGERVGRGANQQQNIADVGKHGWEATASLNVGPMKVKGTYSWNDSRILKNTENPGTYGNGFVATPGASFLQIPTHTANLIAGYVRGATSVTATFNWIGKTLERSGSRPVYIERSYARLNQYLDSRSPINSNFTRSSYGKVDLAAIHRLTKQVSATLNVTNIGNRDNTDGIPVYPAIGRQTTFGVSLKR